MTFGQFFTIFNCATVSANNFKNRFWRIAIKSFLKKMPVAHVNRHAIAHKKVGIVSFRLIFELIAYFQVIV